MTENQKPRLPAPVQQAVTTARRPFEKIAQKYGNLVNWEAESMFALQAIANNSLLQKCDPHSIRDSVINIASIGLSLNPVLKHAALVPRYSTQAKGYLCHCDPMYQGLIATGTDGEKVVNIWAEVVRERDREDGNFKYFGGTEPRVIHTPDPFMSEEMRGPIIGAYCVAEIAGSTHPHVTFMSIDQIHKARDKSEYWKKKEEGPWKDFEEEMCKKTVIKRASKTWPKGTGRLERAVQLANIADGYAAMEPQGATPEQPEEAITEDEAKELRAAARKAHLRVERIYAAFNISKMEELPKRELRRCQKRINMAGLQYILKHAESNETKVSARDWGISLKELEDLGAEVKTKATLVS